ncbi:hypothetical protein WA171_002804 [Blastocystis sp. BT1]
MKAYSLILVFVLLAIGLSWQNKFVPPGGVFPIPVNDYVIMYADSVRKEVENYMGKQLEMYTPESALGQVVNGMMLYVKMRIGQNEAIFLKILNRLNTINLVSMRTNITASEPLTYFFCVC